MCVVALSSLHAELVVTGAAVFLNASVRGTLSTRQAHTEALTSHTAQGRLPEIASLSSPSRVRRLAG